MPNPVNKNHLDVVQVFQTYVTFHGDADRTAVALNMERSEVQSLAIQEKWELKIKEWNQLREGNPQDVQIQINRAVNFVQAARLRNILDKLVSYLSGVPADELVERMSTKGKDGTRTIATRPLTDLVKAAEAAQLMTQRALGDTVQERPREETARKGSSIALIVQEAMGAADQLGLSSMEVVRKELSLPKP